MKTAFDPKTGRWNIRWPGRVSRHDLVYHTPPDDPMHGIALGNGEVGALCWCEGSRFIAVVNRSDLWDDAPGEGFHNWRSEEEEFSTTLRHGGRIVVDFKLPVFDVFYLSDFEARLNLAEATLELRAEGPFGRVTVHAFVAHEDGTFCCRVARSLKQDVPLEVVLERFGSRTFSHWYSLVRRDPSIGLAGTKASCDKDGLYVTHRLTSGAFGLGVRAVAKGRGPKCVTESGHVAKMVFPAGRKGGFDLIGAITSPARGNPLPALKKTLAASARLGLNRLAAPHKKAWKDFWLRSLVEFGDDYLDSLWHLTMYYAAASQRGRYPGRFINGLWAWSRDVQNWNFYFHWNQQQTYWPLNAAGHHDLIDSYLEYRFASLPYARQDARKIFGGDGAFVSDVCDRLGRNSHGEWRNHTPVAQIAMEFWRQYKYTGDRTFLAERALPYILDAARFFEGMFDKGKDGRYHAKDGTGYEGWIRLRDAVTELVYARVLFSTAVEALREAGVDEPRAAKWREIVDHLADPPTVAADRRLIAGGKLLRGLFKGEKAIASRVLAAGVGLEEKRLLTSFVPHDHDGPTQVDVLQITCQQEGKPALPEGVRDDLRCYDGIFPWVENAAVYPSGLVDLDCKDRELFKTTANTIKAFAFPGMGWHPLAAAFARLGMGREARRALELAVVFWQFYPNGWGHYGPMAIMRGESALRFRTSQFGIRDADLPAEEQNKPESKFSFGMWPFRHMGMEAMSCFAAGINESLLQSHHDVIRVAPAVTGDQDARFTLHAQNGFVVSAEVKNGCVRWIAVESRLGRPCRLESPWPTTHLYAKGRKLDRFNNRRVEFATEPSRVYVLVPDDRTMRHWNVVEDRFDRNAQAKQHASGYAWLGRPRMF